MLDITEWAWVFDKTFVVCRIVDNQVFVEIEKTGNARVGEIRGLDHSFFESLNLYAGLACITHPAN